MLLVVVVAAAVVVVVVVFDPYMDDLEGLLREELRREEWGRVMGEVAGAVRV
jgi:hypothetical protein